MKDFDFLTKKHAGMIFRVTECVFQEKGRQHRDKTKAYMVLRTPGTLKTAR